jgi:hypothetical protein
MVAEVPVVDALADEFAIHGGIARSIANDLRWNHVASGV